MLNRTLEDLSRSVQDNNPYKTKRRRQNTSHRTGEDLISSVQDKGKTQNMLHRNGEDLTMSVLD